MKKQIKWILIALCFTLVLSVVSFAACDNNNQSTTKITVTVNVNVDGIDEVTFEIDAGAEFYSELAQYLPQNVGGKVFVGWFDSNEEEITTQTRWNQSGTVTAYWTDGYVVTFDKNNPQAIGEMSNQLFAVDTPSKLVTCKFTSNLTFDGWNTKANGTGESYADEAELTLTANITLYAQWKVTYTEEIWVERFVDGNYVYIKEKTAVITDKHLGQNVSMQTADGFDEPHYFLDYDHEDAAYDAVNLQDGEVLKAYFSIERLTVTYVGEQIKDTVRYNQQYTIRTPEQDFAGKTEIISYSSSQTGDGHEYRFASVVTLTSDLMLYPVTAEVFNDAEGSGDRVLVRDILGAGSAILVVDGVRYLGFLNSQSDSLITFDVNVNEVEIHGKLFSDGKFLYRNEDEFGTFLLGDALFPGDIYTNVMLALDGYGTGVISQMLGDGTDRAQNFFVSYVKTDEGDYFMQYYLPSKPDDINEGYFKIFREKIDGVEDLGIEGIVGYFLICGSEYGASYLVYNGEINSEYALVMDGYGNATYYHLIEKQVNGQTQSVIDFQIVGYYYASENYSDAAPEYVFEPDKENNDSALLIDPFLFILFEQQDPSGGNYYTFFIIKRGEAGVYNQNEGIDYPQLELDGYGRAAYYDSERGEQRLGSYTINTNVNGGFTVIVTFIDEIGGTMRVTLNQQNNTYEPLGDFDIDENGVLNKYYGSDSVIIVPEGVKEISQEAFKDINITSVTLPSTLEKIGDYAFQNGSNNGRSMLKTVYLNAVTPPVLGADVFRWITGEFKIIVPNGSLEAYREAASWIAESDSLKNAAKKTYADYVTSLEEINNKPLFEIVNGVLVSYNNKDENPQNVKITIPDEVTEIAARVFEGRAYIVSVDLNNVTVIGDYAFDSCVGIKSVKFNSATNSVGIYAFYYCLGLTEVDLGDVQNIGDYAFFRCYNIKEVNIGNKIQSIGTFAFSMCAVEVDDNETATAQNELIITIAATTAPQMSQNVFVGSAARIYVNSYDVGVEFAYVPSWALYAVSLRVVSQQSQKWYSMANMGAELVLGDNVLFDNTRQGLYKWDGDRLYIAWFDRSGYEGSTSLNVIVQVGEYDSQTGMIRNFSLYDDSPLVFVEEGTEVEYVNGSETLRIIFGAYEARFNGSAVTIEIVNYRMRFTYQGYVYLLSLSSDNTFSYERNKVQVTVKYTAQDGSEITVTYGNSVNAVGTLKNVDGEERFTTTGWYLTEGENGTYVWTIQWREKIYEVVAKFNDADNTFTYSVDGYAVRSTYRSGEDYIVVTTHSNGKVDMLFNFKTANGTLTCSLSDVAAGVDGNYEVTIIILVDVVNDNGEVIGQVPSEFNGNYLVTLNIDFTYTLTVVS